MFFNYVFLIMFFLNKLFYFYFFIFKKEKKREKNIEIEKNYFLKSWFISLNCKGTMEQSCAMARLELEKHLQ